MRSIRRYIACTAASAILTVGAVALAAPAQAQAQTGAVHQSTASVVLADDGTDDSSGGGLLGGLLKLVNDLLGGLLGGNSSS
ncbi:hypothetical protein [Streptomyces sp. S.PB5]|uniref:hypothetical protein n=1 Tax=Streptomyces sp. S.PB5 TaxID=3020844 RepID=UPI0025AF6E4A|nr:hypothetical protein [Streptomyces sp. S.PB5]MDN3022749.1 hypothetical protein [Streptomyces sp. S.PB5]